MLQAIQACSLSLSSKTKFTSVVYNPLRLNCVRPTHFPLKTSHRAMTRHASRLLEESAARLSLLIRLREQVPNSAADL